MSQSLSSIQVHLIFSTKDRKPVLRPILPHLYPVISTVLYDEQSPAITIGGWDDHLHILFTLNREDGVALVVKNVKTSATKWIKQYSEEYKNFSWQTGYGAFSVSQSEVDKVSRYIENQDTRHQKISFQNEYVKFLEKHKIEYDLKYLWT